MKFVIRVYTGGRFINDAYAKTIAEAKRKASRLCNDFYAPVDRFVICGGKFDGLEYIRINQLFPTNLIIRGEWK